MTSEALYDLVRRVQSGKHEGQYIECKAAESGTPKWLFDTLSSFSNQDKGGVILFGIDEKSGFSVVGVYDPQDLQSKVDEQCKQMEPIVRPLFTVLEIDGKFVVSAEIASIEVFDRPCFYKGAGRMKGSYVRSGGADNPMTEYEVYSYEAYKRQVHDDLRVIDRASMDDLNSAQLDSYLVKLKVQKPKFATLPLEDTLKLQGIAIGGKPTLAGVMLFGKYPQGFNPQLSITAMVAAGNDAFEYSGETRFIDNQRIEGTIPEMLDLAVGFVRRNMRVSTVVDSVTTKRKDKEEYPLLAIREIILNSLIHRDYSIHTAASPIRLIMYRDRLELENPGGLYGRLTIDELGKAVADTRNEFIAGILEILIDSENRFTGIPNIRGAMKASGLPEPEFKTSRGQFKVTLRNSVIEDWEKKLIEFCKTPRTRQEIAELLSVSTLAYAMSKYIQPLLDLGRLKMTIPKTPKSPNQQYFSQIEH